MLQHIEDVSPGIPEYPPLSDFLSAQAGRLENSKNDFNVRDRKYGWGLFPNNFSLERQRSLAGDMRGV